MKRLSLAFRCFFSLLFKGAVSETLLAELRTRLAPEPLAEPMPPVGPRPVGQTAPPAATGAAARVVPPVDNRARAVQMLALLQRDGRLVDFFAEDIAQYEDAQVGAAVRDMHESCRGTLSRYLTLEPVIAGEEGRPLTIEPGFDPAAVKLIGNVTGRLPARGVLRHHGWRAKDIRLPDIPAGTAGSVIAPAEVEIT